MREAFAKSRWLIVAGVVAALTAWGMSWMSAPEVPESALAAAPAGSSIVMRVDVAAVTASHAWSLLIEEDGPEDGVRRVERACGYDPLELVEEAFVFVSGTRERPFGEVGFVAQGDMARGAANRRRLLDCVGAVVPGGGALRRIEIDGVPAIASSSGESHAAFVGGDGVVAGDRAMVARAIRVAAGDAPSAAGDATLARLWARVSADRDIVAVARLPERWIPAMRRMARRLESDLSALSSVRALGIGVRVRSGLSIGLAAETADAAAARELERALLTKLDALMDEPLVRLSTLGRVLRRVRTEAQGSELVVTASVTDPQLDSLVSLWRDLRATAAAPDRGSPSGTRTEERRPDAGAATNEQ